MVKPHRSRVRGQHELPMERCGTMMLLFLYSVAVLGEKLLAFRRKSA